MSNFPFQINQQNFINQWTCRGVEPRSPGCKPGIFPLDEQPITSNFQLIPDGIEPSLSCVSGRRLRLWATGSFPITPKLTGVRVELTESQGSRPCRFAKLRTRPNSAPAPCALKLQVWGSHPTCRAYEAPLSLAHLRQNSINDQGESRTPTPRRARRSERRMFSSYITWSSLFLSIVARRVCEGDSCLKHKSLAYTAGCENT
jgi:hypothetical protein